MFVQCNECGNQTTLTLNKWQCDCSGAWEPIAFAPFNVTNINRDDYTIWRYGAMLGLDVQSPHIHMGVGWTPLLPMNLGKRQIHLKLEYLFPSGSFKDRGVNTMVNQLVKMGVGCMVEDSSGNAGASLAAHGARHQIRTQIFVPEYASFHKQYQIEIYGAEIIQVPGTRKDTEKAAQSAVGGNRTYASHAYHPAYLAGQTTAAYEVWEQLGKRAPDWIICPVGQGGQFLGFWFGFSHLLGAGLIKKMPRLVAVQAAQVNPFFQAWQAGLSTIPAIELKGTTIAEGVSITNPVRGKRLLQAVRETNGLVLSIEENDILNAQKILAFNGYYVEATSALGIAGLIQLEKRINNKDLILLPLTGSGLKGTPKNNKGT